MQCWAVGQSGTALYLFPFFCVHFAGAKVPDVEQMVENHLETLIIKHFDPKKADSIFSAEGEVRVHLWVIKLNALMTFTW